MASDSPFRGGVRSLEEAQTPTKKRKKPANDDSKAGEGESSPQATETPTKKRKKPANDDSGAGEGEGSQPAKVTTAKKRRGEAANISDATAGQTLEEKYLSSLDQLQKDRDTTREKLAAEGKLNPVYPDYGVFVVGIRISVEKGSDVAGYLNLHNCSQLGQLAAVLQGPLDKLEELAKKRFDIPAEKRDKNPKAITLEPQKFFARLAEGRIYKDDVESTAAPNPARYPSDTPGNLTRFYLYLMRFFHAARNILLKDSTFSGVFSGPFDPRHTRTFVDGLNYHGEDLYRALVFYTFSKRKISKKDKEGNVRGTYQNLPTLPIFAHLKPGGQNSAQAAARQARNINTIFQAGGGVTDYTGAELMRDFEAGEHDDDLEAANQSDALVSRTKVRLRDDLDSLDDETRRRVMGLESGYIEVLYDDTKYQNKSFFDKIDIDRRYREIQASTALEIDFAEASAEDGPSKANAKAEMEAKHRFLGLQKSLNRRSARQPGFEEAVEQLGIEVETDLSAHDPTTGEDFSIEFRGIFLKPWQPTAIYWLTKMLTSTIQAAILADDTGLGKTVMVFACVLALATLTTQAQAEWDAKYESILHPYRVEKGWDPDDPDAEDPFTDAELIRRYDLDLSITSLGERPQHRPVLICCPPTALTAWLDDHDKFFNSPDSQRHITLRTFCSLGGSRASSRDQRMAILGGKASNLNAWAKGLSKDEEQTSRTVVLTTLQSWQNKVLEQGVLYKKKGPPQPNADDDRNDGDEDDIDEDADPTMGADEEDYYAGNKLKVDSDLFSLDVIDEAHRVKNKNSLQTDANYQLTRCKFLLVTATPCKRDVADLSGLLRFMYKNIAPLMPSDPPNGFPNLNAYKSLYKTMRDEYDHDIHAIPEEKQWDYLLALEPNNFRKQCGGGDKVQEDGVSGVGNGADILPLPSAICILRRCKGELIYIAGRDIIIGGEIPRHRATNVELRQGAYQQSLHDFIVQETKNMGSDPVVIVDDEDETVSRGGSLKRRRLQLATFHPLLDQFVRRKVNTNATAVHKHADQGIDSFTFFHTWSKNDLHGMPPSTRVEIAHWLVSPSVKLQYLTRLLLKHIIQRGEKVIVWANEPLTLWLVELLLEVYQIQYSSIRAGIKNAQRVKAERDFNSNPAVMVCVLSSRSAQESMNLQRGGHVQIIMDVVSLTSAIQMMGRSLRIGQKHEVVVYMLTCDESYDQVLQATYQTRYRVIVASNLEITPEHIETVLKDLSAEKKLEMQLAASEDFEAVTSEDWATLRLRGAYANAVMRELFGFRSDREGKWASVYDPTAKNLEPEEIIFRLAYGGQVGDAVAAQLEAEESKPPKSTPKTSPHKQMDPDQQESADWEPATSASPFAMPMTVRRTAPQVTPADAIRHLIRAAEMLLEKPAYRAERWTVAELLTKAKSWVPHPSRYIDMAIKTAADGAAAKPAVATEATLPVHQSPAPPQSPPTGDDHLPDAPPPGGDSADHPEVEAENENDKGRKEVEAEDENNKGRKDSKVDENGLTSEATIAAGLPSGNAVPSSDVADHTEPAGTSEVTPITDAVETEAPDVDNLELYIGNLYSRETLSTLANDIGMSQLTSTNRAGMETEIVQHLRDHPGAVPDLHKYHCKVKWDNFEAKLVKKS